MWWWQSANVSRLEARVEHLDHLLAHVQEERDYWRTRAERLLDMALFKRHEITAPVFEERKSLPDRNPLLHVLGAMNTMETDSAKRASTAAPMVPMK